MSNWCHEWVRNFHIFNLWFTYTLMPPEFLRAQFSSIIYCPLFNFLFYFPVHSLLTKKFLNVICVYLVLPNCFILSIAIFYSTVFFKDFWLNFRNWREVERTFKHLKDHFEFHQWWHFFCYSYMFVELVVTPVVSQHP